MLILPPGHAETLRQPRGLRRRERIMLSGVLTVVAALVVVLVLSVSSADPQSAGGCISVGLAYSTGGQKIDRCGAAARAMCASVNAPGGTSGAAARAVSVECRKAGLPVG